MLGGMASLLLLHHAASLDSAGFSAELSAVSHIPPQHGNMMQLHFRPALSPRDPSSASS